MKRAENSLKALELASAGPTIYDPTLRLWTRSGTGEPWAMMGEPVRSTPGTIAHATTHLSEFALFGEPEEQARYRVFLPLVVR